MEVASPLPFPSQAGTKRPFVFSPPEGTTADATAAGGCSTMEHDSSEHLGADAATATFGHHAAKRRRRFSAADENVANGSASASAFPAFAAAPGGFGFGFASSSSSPTKSAAAAGAPAPAVPPHGSSSLKRTRLDLLQDSAASGASSASIWNSQATSHNHQSQQQHHQSQQQQQQKVVDDLRRHVDHQSSEINRLASEKDRAVAERDALRTEHDRIASENKILKKAVAIQQERQNQASAEMDAARRYKAEADERIRRLEQMTLALQYRLQAQEPCAGNDFMGFSPRPPDVY